MPSAVRPAFAPAHRMIDRVHRLTPDARPPSHVTLSPRFADPNILVIGIAHPPYSRSAFLANHSHFAARQNNTDPVALFSDYFRGISRPPDHLTALPGRHLYIVNFKTGRDRAHRHTVAHLRLTDITALDPVTGLYSKRSQYIPLFAVGVVQQ